MNRKGILNPLVYSSVFHHDQCKSEKNKKKYYICGR